MRLTDFLFLGLLSLPLGAFADTLPICGGEGPMPLPVKTHAVQESIGTTGDAQDFQVWENSQQIVYRNEKGDLYLTDLSGGDGGRKFSHAPAPLTHFAEPQERYLTTDIGAWFHDTQGGPWLQYNSVVPSMDTAFWHGNDLYALASTYDLSGSVFRLYKYHANDDYVTPLCDGLHFDVKNGYHLAKGHSDPYIYLYKTTPLSQGTILNLYRVDANRCEVTELAEFKLVTPGHIENVFRFEKENAIAIKTDTVSHNLLWKQGTAGCQYFDIGDVQPMVVNPRLPVLAMWSPGSPGISLYDFRNVSQVVQKTTVLEDFAQPLHGIASQDLYLSDNGQQLYVRPSAQKNRAAATLLRLRFNGFLSDTPPTN